MLKTTDIETMHCVVSRKSICTHQYILHLLFTFTLLASCSHCSNHPEKEAKSKGRRNQCIYSGTAWNKIINSNDNLFPTFLGWLPFLTQSYVSGFPVDDNVLNIPKNVRNVLFSVVEPQPFSSEVSLVAISHDVLIHGLNLDPSVVECPLFHKFISGHNSAIFPSALAHRYGGHQFGYWSGQLGDGRAALLGSFLNSDGNILELNLKGSGLTPYSRTGDGRAVLRSSVREFLVSEAMHFLGAPTSRALSLVVSDDEVIRDEFYNGRPMAERGAMVVRVAPSWFRIGSLEILAFHGELHLLQSLLDYLIKHHYSNIDVGDDDRYLMLFEEIVNGTAHLIAAWQTLGFTHGVCNTDNFSLLSITIDYGPFGFLDNYDPSFVPNTSDDEGRYSYGKQPYVGHFNLDKLRLAMNPVFTNGQKKAAKIVLDGYYDILNRTLLQRFVQKLGLSSSSPSAADGHLVETFLNLMRRTRSDFTMSFRQLGEVDLDDLMRGVIGPSQWALAQLKTNSKFGSFLEKYRTRLREEGISEPDRRRKMCEINPVYILRTWMAHVSIQQAHDNDFSEVRRLQRVLSSPFTRQAEAERVGYSSRPPLWAASIKVSCSS